ncbi:MAG: DNA polymerase IV [Ilumatobacteraceae bacterium]
MFVEPTILHADLDAFFASVEQRDDPALRGRPVCVGIGVVMAASYEARAYGVRSAMGGHEARRLCPDAVFVPPRLHAYTEASRAVFEVFDDTTPFVEPISVDEAFLDVRGLRRIRGDAEAIAGRLRAEVRDRVDLPITVGVATTKSLAKVASRFGKPDGLCVVPGGGETAFLHPLPIEYIWGVGPKNSVKLRDRGFQRIGDLAMVPEAALVAILGPAAGRHVHALACCRDPRPVRGGQRRRSIGSQSALGRRRRAPAEIDAVLVGIVDRVTRRMRSAHRVGRTVTLRLRFDDFTRITRSHTLPEATANTEVVTTAARRLLAAAEPLIREHGLTLIGLTVANLSDDSTLQLALPFERHDGDDLDHALDDGARQVRQRQPSPAPSSSAAPTTTRSPSSPTDGFSCRSRRHGSACDRDENPPRRTVRSGR